MALPNPDKIETLSITRYGKIDMMLPAKASVLTNNLSCTYYGQIMSGNNWISGSAPVVINKGLGFFAFCGLG